jgi:hypothetical protein
VAQPPSAVQKLVLAGWRALAMIDYKVNSNSRRSKELLCRYILSPARSPMKQPWAALLLFSCAALGQTQSPLAATPSTPAPAAPVRNFATVTAITRTALDSKSCITGKEFRSAITSPFVFSGEQVESGAELVGHIQVCNRDEKGKLLIAIVLVDSIVLPKSAVVPITAVLQALGPPLPPSRVVASGTDIGYVQSMEFHQDMRANTAAQVDSDISEVARRGPSDVGILNDTSTGVRGLKHVLFENATDANVVAWMFSVDKAPLSLTSGSQIVVRFRVAPIAAKP